MTFHYITNTTTACRKDGQEIAHQNRETIREVCAAAEQNRILVTHGTDIDTMIIQTGLFLKPSSQYDADVDADDDADDDDDAGVSVVL